MQEPGPAIRRAIEGDVDAIAKLVLRFYTFNEEFDPAWAAEEDLEKAANLVRIALNDPSNVILVAECMGKIVGVARAVIVEEPMLSHSPIGLLKELYVIPEFRRRGVATRLIEEIEEALRERGAKILAAEFPSRNQVAKSFYEKLRFRAFKSIYIRETGV